MTTADSLFYQPVPSSVTVMDGFANPIARLFYFFSTG
jgi:hypothetical protein